MACKSICIGLCVAACIGIALAAKGEIRWLATTYDFHAFREAAGPQRGELRFVNLGPDTTIINRVKPSCGCTAADYTTDLIAPGDTATVSFEYNPAGRPGPFAKSLKVYTGINNDISILRLVGTVIGAPESLDSRYPEVVGPLRLSDKRLMSGEVPYGKAAHRMFSVYNQSSDTIRPAASSESDALSVDFSTNAIPPGELATVSVYFNSRQAEKMGVQDYIVRIKPDEDLAETFDIIFTANVVADTSGLTAEQLAVAPLVEVLPELIDLGTCLPGGEKKFDFILSNAGKSPLVIKRIYAPGGGVAVRKAPVRLGAGKTGKVEAALMVPAAQGAFAVRLDVLSTDPLHPVKTIKIVGDVRAE